MLGIIAALGFYGWSEYQRMAREHPERFPWTELSLADPIGPFTGDKLAGLGNEPLRCLALVDEVALANNFAPPVANSEPACGYADGISMAALTIAPSPGDLVTACPIAAAMHLWARDVVAPAAATHLGTEVTAFTHLGSYNCRRLYGRTSGNWSRHATADALDISGFVLADGRRLTLLADWDGGSEAEQAFLREVRNGACELFSSTLSPDYNAAHADHFHLAMREEAVGWSACR
nr:extensin family protein [Sphingomicrobium sediminis]